MKKKHAIDTAELAEWDQNRERREALVRRMCQVMGWPYSTSPVYAGLRQVAIGNATVISNDKLQQIIERLEDEDVINEQLEGFNCRAGFAPS